MIKSILAAALFVLMVSCGDSPQPGPAAAVPSALGLTPSVISIIPPGTTEGAKFNIQPNGQSAFSVTGTNFAPGSVIVADGQKLKSAFGHAAWMSAFVPDDMYAKAGVIEVKVVNADGKESNTFEFKVDAKK